MSKIQSKYKDLLTALASPEAYKSIKSFISSLYEQLGNVQGSSFKPEHRDQFINIRSQFLDLINQTRTFCDKAIPYLDYALQQFKSPSPIDVKRLVEKLVQNVDPKQILKQCQQLEKKLIEFTNQITGDDYYKKSNIMVFLCVGAGVALAITSLIGLVFAPIILEIEIALGTAAPAFIESGISSLVLMSKGLTTIQVENNFKECMLKINNTITVVYDMKMKLSDLTQNHTALEIRLDFEDFRELQPIYENLLNNIQEIRVLCCKPFPN